MKRGTLYVSLGVIVLLLGGPSLIQWGKLVWLDRRLDHRLQQLAQERERLLIERHRLHSDPTYLEGWRHTIFKVTRPGEYIIPLNQTSDLKVQKSDIR